MDDRQQDGRLSSLYPLLERRSNRRQMLENNKLYGLELSDSSLQRNDWTFPQAESLRYQEIGLNNYQEFVTTFQDQDDGSYYNKPDRTYLNLLYAPSERKLLINGSFDKKNPPLEREILELAKSEHWVTEEYIQLWHNDSGGSAALTDVGKSGFILQTPNDGGPFCSLSIFEFQPLGRHMSSCGGLFVSDENYTLNSLLGSVRLHANDDPICKYLAMSMVLPIKVFQRHCAATRKSLVALAKEVTETEERIAEGKVPTNTEEYNKLLNEMNLLHMKIHRRWNFELELGASILQYFEKSANPDHTKRKHNVSSCIKPMRDEVEREIRYSKTLQYDFDTIPRRIRNQSKAIFNLMIQRDNQLNLTIAEHSRRLNIINTKIATSSAKIAEESRRDSASMKTIAVLTLIFLPATSVASIFSMSVFNFNPSSNSSNSNNSTSASPISNGTNSDQTVTSMHYLLLYFEITIPLTIVILACWLIFYYKFQKPQNRRNKDLEIALEPLPPDRTTTLPLQQYTGL